MSTLTTRLQLLKAAGGENVDVAAQLAAAYDIIDLLLPQKLCTSSTRPGTPFQGQTIYETDTGLSYFYTGSAWNKIVTEAPVASAASISALYGGSGSKNKFANAVGFPINQRGASSYSATGYTCDRWYFTLGSGATASIAVSAPTPGTNPGYSLNQLAFNRSVAGSTESIIEQPIEHVSTFAGQTITVSLLANAATISDIGCKIYQYFGTGGSPSANVNTAGSVKSIPAGSGLTTLSWTFNVPSITGKTLGTNLNSFLSIQFYRPTTGNGPLVAQGIFAAQVELGSAFTGWGSGTPAEELEKCQRYYYRIDPGSIATGNQRFGVGGCITANTGGFYLTFPVTLRAAPTFGVSSTAANFSIYNCNTGATVACSSVPSDAGSTKDGSYINAATASGLAAGASLQLHRTSNATPCWIEFVAEM